MPRTPVGGPVVIPNAIEIRIIWTLAGRTFSNVLHGQNPGGAAATDATAQTLMSGISTQFTSSGWAGFVHPTCQLFQVQLKSLHTANQVGHFSTGAAIPGTATGAGAPLNCALVVTLRTAQAGVAFRGRSYLGGLADSALQNMFDTTTAANTAAAAFVTGIMTVASGAQLPIGIAQRALNAGTTHGGAPLPARAANIIPVTLAEVHNARVDSQRRRTGR
jgi:hypothetical protein